MDSDFMVVQLSAQRYVSDYRIPRRDLDLATTRRQHSLAAQAPRSSGKANTFADGRILVDNPEIAAMIAKNTILMGANFALLRKDLDGSTEEQYDFQNRNLFGPRNTSSLSWKYSPLPAGSLKPEEFEGPESPVLHMPDPKPPIDTSEEITLLRLAVGLDQTIPGSPAIARPDEDGPELFYFDDDTIRKANVFDEEDPTLTALTLMSAQLRPAVSDAPQRTGIPTFAQFKPTDAAHSGEIVALLKSGGLLPALVPAPAAPLAELIKPAHESPLAIAVQVTGQDSSFEIFVDAIADQTPPPTAKPLRERRTISPLRAAMAVLGSAILGIIAAIVSGSVNTHSITHNTASDTGGIVIASTLNSVATRGIAASGGSGSLSGALPIERTDGSGRVTSPTHISTHVHHHFTHHQVQRAHISVTNAAGVYGFEHVPFSSIARTSYADFLSQSEHLGADSPIL